MLSPVVFFSIYFYHTSVDHLASWCAENGDGAASITSKQARHLSTHQHNHYTPSAARPFSVCLYLLPTPGRDTTGTMFTTYALAAYLQEGCCTLVHLSGTHHHQIFPLVGSLLIVLQRCRCCAFLSPSPFFPCRRSRPPSSHPNVFTLLT